MRKGQLSLEFLIYLSLAGLSLLFATGILHSAAPGVRNALGYYSTSTLLSGINDALLFGSGSSNVSGFLPAGICNSSVEGKTLTTNYGTFEFIETISVPPNAFCPDNKVAQFTVQKGLGEAELIRVSG